MKWRRGGCVGATAPRRKANAEPLDETSRRCSYSDEGQADPRARPLTESRRRDQDVLAGLQPCQQPIGTLGLLGGAPDDATYQKELRIVASMQFGVNGLHADTYSTDRAGLSRDRLSSF